MSKFNTYPTNSIITKSFFKYLNAVYLFIFFLLVCIIIPFIFNKFISTRFIFICASFLLVLFLFLIQKRIQKKLKPDGEIEFLKNKINWSNQTEKGSYNEDEIKSIKIKKGFLKYTYGREYKYKLIEIKGNNDKTKDFLIYTSSRDEDVDIIKTLEIFTTVNKINFE